MSFQLQYISDIHLEHHDKNNEGYLVPSMFLKPSAPYLALCGDIGNPDLPAYEALLRWCSKSYKLVFLVAGNHEFYNYRSSQNSDMATRLQKIRIMCSQYNNIVFLHRDTHFLPEYNLRILGCTLWSDTSVGDEEKIWMYMNDCRQILMEDGAPLSPTKMTELHSIDKDWIREELEKARKRNESVIVLTHHLPSYQLIHEKYQDHPMNMCFASNCEELLQEPVKAWICGHSHTGVKLNLFGVQCMLNPYGYPGEKVETRKRDEVFTVETKGIVVDL
jgi:hypothetical protein